MIEAKIANVFGFLSVLFFNKKGRLISFKSIAAKGRKKLFFTKKNGFDSHLAQLLFNWS